MSHPLTPGYNGGMDRFTSSHRQAWWLIGGLSLALLVGFTVHELNWVRQRRDYLTQVQASIGGQSTPAVSQTLPRARTGGWQHWPTRWLFNVVPVGHDVILCERVEPQLAAKFAAGRFPDDDLEKLDQVRDIRWLFPEASIEFVFLVDSATGLPLAAEPSASQND
jgi:hypothetical protein